MTNKTIHIHSTLSRHGGAVRVARLLGEMFVNDNWHITRTCEVPDYSTPAKECSSCAPKVYEERYPAQVIEPENIVAAAPHDSIIHIHSSSNMVAALNAIADANRQCVITLHDTSLLTGGCPAPMGCDGWAKGCYAPCPRLFARARELQKLKKEAVLRAKPLLVSPSSWLKKMATTVMPEIACSVIPNGVESPELASADISGKPGSKQYKQAARSRLGIAPDALVALFLAHGGEKAVYKGGEYWLEVWEKIQSRFDAKKRDRLLCCMAGGERMEKQGNILRWPYVGREHALLLMASADCLLYPTLADNHSMVILEAMSTGLPVVSFTVGGVPEQVQQGKTGMLIPEGNWDEFISQAYQLMNSQSQMRDFGLNAIQAHTQHFTADKMKQRYDTLYQRVLF